MATMNVSLPDEMKKWIEEQTASGDYANSSDYMRDLIRRDRVRREKIAAMRERISESVQSGISDKSLDDVIEEALAKTRVSA